jgi:hypothetical protein
VSDTSEGEGWWQASDGKWYAPELAPTRKLQRPKTNEHKLPEPTNYSDVGVRTLLWWAWPIVFFVLAGALHNPRLVALSVLAWPVVVLWRPKWTRDD